uniref:Glutamyl-tRNA(Gln) amidotransferase subunit B, mitochondrial n=1 Tax=Biomphalaria glabrata TaxID=6526 RepID=A0A2C9L0P0_BIOGL
MSHNVSAGISKVKDGWKVDIGLEIHAQVSSNSKLFSGASTCFNGPNNSVSFFDAAFPGTLPVLNFFAIEQAIRTGIAIGANINMKSYFDRKHYFYPDLPSGYQITQFYSPIVIGGFVLVKHKKINIRSIHLEQDAGKSIHDESFDYTYIDLNRAGIALMEIVTAPDISSAEEAAEFLKNLRSIMQFIGTCDGSMENGSMRCDANVSVRREGSEVLGERCEIKNLNSIRSIILAINYEAMRQIDLIESGKIVKQETRLFDIDSCRTEFMRSKESCDGYYYFRDPDLPCVDLSNEFVEKIGSTISELPHEKFNRYVDVFGLSEYDANVLVSDKSYSEYFEIASNGANPKIVSNWITTELFGYLNKHSLQISDSPVAPENMLNLVRLIENGTISGKIAKSIFQEMCSTGKGPMDIVLERDLVQISDHDSILNVIDSVIQDNIQSVRDYRNGKDKLFGFFVGQVMKKMLGKANPSIVNELLLERLKDKIE